MAVDQITVDGYRIEPLTTQTWGLFAGLAERHNGVWGGCWCTHFHPDCAERGQSAEGNREIKRRLVDQGTAHAALVVDGPEAVAWAEYGTPEELPGIHHRIEYLKTADRLPDYRITCLFVDRRYRRRGVAEIAVRGALALIARDGGGVVEAYPHDIAGAKTSASFLYNATRTMYERLGFAYDRPKGLKNCVMMTTVAAR